MFETSFCKKRKSESLGLSLPFSLERDLKRQQKTPVSRNYQPFTTINEGSVGIRSVKEGWKMRYLGSLLII